jgi:hypothetical protein
MKYVRSEMKFNLTFRFAFSIDPQRGHKRPTAKGRPTTVKHKKVQNLIKCIRDNKIDLTSSESSGSS